MFLFGAAILDSGQFLTHSTDVAGCPKPDAHTTDELQLRCGYLLGCDVPLKADKTDAELPGGFTC
jgi:hypothetical protein